jgi:hypothetical protein
MQMGDLLKQPLDPKRAEDFKSKGKTFVPREPKGA